MPSRREFLKSASLPVGASLVAGTGLFAQQKVDYAAQAREIHKTAILFDGHNDLPWQLRDEGDISFSKTDIAKKLGKPFQTDIPRMKAGGLNAQFWSVYIPGTHPNPLRTVLEQIDIVRRMIEKYPEHFEQALTAADVRRIATSGKCASMMGVEGGVAIENDLTMLRIFYDLGVRYMTLTHNQTLDWADAATDKPKSQGLSPFGVRVVKEMNRLGMLVDISHVSVDTMNDALDITQAPVIASHSSAFALCPHPRNVNDDVLRRVKTNGGVIMINFFSSFVVPGAADTVAAMQKKIRAEEKDRLVADRMLQAWLEQRPELYGSIGTVVDHIEHVARVAGIDSVGIGSDFDGISRWPKGLDSVADYPKITEELLRRGHSETNIRKILGENVLRALEQAEKVAARLKKESAPDLDPPTRMPHVD
ncbi:MAG: dipeptidase [Isosphaeraceae bacterium]